MANVINATSTGNGGLITTGDDSGILNIQTNETTAVSVDASQNLTFTNGINAPNTFGFKNRIINGAMTFDQRNAGNSFTVTGSNYTLDRWLAFTSVTSKFSTQQSSTAPANFTNSLLCTSLSAYSIGASEICTLNHLIEGYNVADFGFGTAYAKSFTFSFWVRSSLTGTFSTFFSNSGQSRWYVAPFTISSANTWEYKTITVPGDTSGTWLTTNVTGMYASFQLSVGSSFQTSASSAWSGASTMYGITGQQSLVGTNGATFYITGVQLEKGTQATSFDYRPYTTELQLCQRYYEKSYNIDVTPGTGSSGPGLYDITATSNNGSNAYVPIFFKVSKRATPTVTGYSYSAGTSGVWSYDRSGNAGNPLVAFAAAGQTSTAAYMNVGGANAAVEVYGHWVASSEL